MKAEGYWREMATHDMDFESLVEWLPRQLVKQSMTWDKRATILVGAMESNAFVFMAPKVDAQLRENALMKTFMTTAL
jgi:hypothetical protein